MKKKMCLLAAMLVSVCSTGCKKIDARIEIKQGNELYMQEKYAQALPHYEKARRKDPSFPELDRLIGYSYIGMFQPDNPDPKNQKIVDVAAGELQRYLKKVPEDATAREALINLFLNANRTSQAIDFFKAYLKDHPADLPAVKSIATLYAKQGDFAQALNWYEKITLLDSRNPESFYVFGVVCYEKVAKNPPLDIAERNSIIERGKAALRKATELKADYFEATVYLNLLLREEAKLEIDPIKQQALIAEADGVRAKAVAIAQARKKSKKAS